MLSSLFAKITTMFMAIIMYLFPSYNYPALDINVDDDKTNYEYVFVHGLGGWGEYQLYYDLFPYWGVMGGDLMKYLSSRGYS